MFVEVDGRTKLKNVDNFLRNIWLECCGHLSSFNIRGQEYVNHLDPDPFFNRGSKSMSVNTSSIFESGMIFDYTYDFGSSTELVLSVISDKPGKITAKMGRRDEGMIKLVARNNEIVFKCAKCKKEIASQICADCIDTKDRNKASFCDNCIQSHSCGEEMALPIVNSPRSGECGYTG